jgi:hypothetical protein
MWLAVVLAERVVVAPDATMAALEFSQVDEDRHMRAVGSGAAPAAPASALLDSSTDSSDPDGCFQGPWVGNSDTGDGQGWSIPCSSKSSMLQETQGNAQDFRVGVDKAPVPEQPYRIPYQLFLTSKFPSLSAAPPDVRENVQHVLDMNAGIHVTWFDDDACASFLRATSKPLHHAFLLSKHGPFKSDICRTAYLAKNGGWYMDLDVDLRQPFVELVAPETAFVSIFGAENPAGNLPKAILNAVIGAMPGSLVMRKAVHTLEATAMKNCVAGIELTCGTAALEEGFRLAFKSCGVPVPTRPDMDHEPAACGQPARMLVEVDLANPRQRRKVSAMDPTLIDRAIDGRKVPNFRGARNMDAHFKGLDFALLAVGHKKPFVAGYSRFDKCTWWGCDQNPNKRDLSAPVAVRKAPDGKVWTEDDYTAASRGHRLPSTWPEYWAELPPDADGKLADAYLVQMQKTD